MIEVKNVNEFPLKSNLTPKTLQICLLAFYFLLIAIQAGHSPTALWIISHPSPLDAMSIVDLQRRRRHRVVVP